VDVYVFRLTGSGCAGVEFLQARRVTGKMAGTWQPVMGHSEDGESAVDTALRELAQETQYRPNIGLIRMWQLESVNTYFLASEDCVVMAAGFAVQVDVEVPPRLNDEHDAFRWIRRDHVDRVFVWPGQRVAIEQIVRDILPGVDSGDLDQAAKNSIAEVLRIDLTGR
jgi:dATP pyrophosphohydrolase